MRNGLNSIAAARCRCARGTPIELRWQDEARVRQQGTLTRVWAAKGSRPPAPRDQRYSWAYLFGAVCPVRGVGAGLVLPVANGHAMNEHLAGDRRSTRGQICRQVAPGAHAVVTLDGAGWHQPGGRLRVPDNVSLLPLPPYSPELNSGRDRLAVPAPEPPQQPGLRRHPRRRLQGINALVAEPARIASIATRNWAAVTG